MQTETMHVAKQPNKSYTFSDKSPIQLLSPPPSPPNNLLLLLGVEHDGGNATLSEAATAKKTSSVVVGDGVSKAAATIALLGNDGTGALSGVEATAAGRAIGI